MVKTHAFTPKSLAILAVVALFTLALAVVPLMSVQALGQASLTLSDPRPGEQGVEYLLNFDSNDFTPGTINGIVVTISDDATVGSGSAPAGIDTSSATLNNSSTALETASNFTVTSPSTGVIEMVASDPDDNTGGSIILENIDNGTEADTTYYLSFTTYADTALNDQIDEVVVAFVYTDGELVTLNIPPTLTFNVNSVASGTVNGATISVPSTGTGIDFTDEVNPSNNGISAHELEVTTNAAFGFVVYLRSTGPFSSAGHDINDTLGTNAGPDAFSADESWGYTTDDDNLETGPGAPGRFATNLWAAFTTTNAPVFDEITGFQPGTESTFVGHQVGIDAATPAGSYQTTLIYTAVPTY